MMKRHYVLLLLLLTLKSSFSGEGFSQQDSEIHKLVYVLQEERAETVQKTYKSHSVLASGKWIKLAGNRAGIQKITYQKLSEWGISSPQNIAVYSNGGFMLPKMNNIDYPDDLTRLPVMHTRDNAGKESVFFYSTGSTRWLWDASLNMFTQQLNPYSDSVYFFLTSDGEKSAGPQTNLKIDDTPVIVFTTYDECAYREDEKTNLIKSGRQWFGERIFSQKDYSFSFPNAVEGGNAVLRVAALARSSDQSNIDLSVNGIDRGILNFSRVTRGSHGPYADYRSLYQVVPAGKLITIGFSYENLESGAEAWIDFITLNVESKLQFAGEQITVRNSKARAYTVIQYEIAVTGGSPMVWDITQPLDPKIVSGEVSAGLLRFISHGGIAPEFVLFDPSSGTFPEPVFSGTVKNQDIHGLPDYDMIIVTHPLFLRQAEELAEFHRQFDNLAMLVVTTTEVFNEFSSGIPDVSAIRNMSRMFYERQSGTGTPLRYLLLFGDGSYDNRRIVTDFEEGNYNFIPTYQTEESINDSNSAVSDDFFGLLERDEGEITGTVDIGIGRIPCRTTIEAEIILSKIVGYASSKSMGEWRNSICFIADDEDWNLYMSDSEAIIDSINQSYPGFFVDKIYLDSYQQVTTSAGDQYPEVNKAINNRVNKGTLILNYMGHANTQSLAHEKVLGIDDIKSWNNANALPVFVTATCEFSRFDGDATSAGEEILLNPTGGGVALFSTTRLVYQHRNTPLSRNFYKALFMHDADGEKFRLGDAIMFAKNKTNDWNMRNFTLLSDPALRLAFPKYEVATKSINGIRPGAGEIRIGALGQVTICGEVTDLSGQCIETFNGQVITTVFDKAITVRTLQNDGSPAFEYPVQNNVIYKGSSAVQEGKFELTFIVPKDITYSVGQGKIIYYASDGNDDANGALSDFLIGGSSANPVIDNDPPQIELFMNNEDFKPYDKVSSNSLLIVKLFDESGINTVGAGIGHDLTAVLDGDYSNQMVLNDYYSSEINDYQRGKIIFPVNNLEPGEHRIRVKVWDIQNNSSEEEIVFIVEEGFKILLVKTFPTHIRTFSDFEITHNLPGENFETNLEVFNLLGQRVYSAKEMLGSGGTTKIRLRWDLFRSNFMLYNSQILVYRITLTNPKGMTALGTGKLYINLKN